MRRYASPNCSPLFRSTCTVSWVTPFSASRMRARRGLGAVAQSYKVIMAGALLLWCLTGGRRGRRGSDSSSLQLVLRLGVKVAGIMPLAQLAGRVAIHAVHLAPALHCRA